MTAFKATGDEVPKGAAGLRMEKRKAKEGRKAKDPSAPKRPRRRRLWRLLEREPREGHEVFARRQPQARRLRQGAPAVVEELGKKPCQKRYQKKAAAYQKAM